MRSQWDDVLLVHHAAFKDAAAALACLAALCAVPPPGVPVEAKLKPVDGEMWLWFSLPGAAPGHDAVEAAIGEHGGLSARVAERMAVGRIDLGAGAPHRDVQAIYP